jgi:hypothetical protein
MRVAREVWEGDPATPILLERIIRATTPLLMTTRSAVVPADTTTNAWASDLVTGSLADFLSSLAPPAASGELFRRSHMLNFTEHGVLVVPGITAASTDAPWVKAGDPIPVRQLNTSSVSSLVPHGIKVIDVLTREMVAGSHAEQVVRMALNASVGAKLDAAVFASTVATATASAGLLYGLATLGASSGTTHDALRLDIGKLIDAVAPVGGTNLVFVGAPGVAAKMLADVGAQFPYPILSSGALAAQTLVCISPDALVVAVDPTPQIDVDKGATVTMEDTTPLPLVDAGSTPAPNTRSFWQTDSLGIRMTMQLSFGLRHASGIAMISSCTW